jgi:hypothetical protein
VNVSNFARVLQDGPYFVLPECSAIAIASDWEFLSASSDRRLILVRSLSNRSLHRVWAGCGSYYLELCSGRSFDTVFAYFRNIISVFCP